MPCHLNTVRQENQETTRSKRNRESPTNSSNADRRYRYIHSESKSPPKKHAPFDPETYKSKDVRYSTSSTHQSREVPRGLDESIHTATPSNRQLLSSIRDLEIIVTTLKERVVDLEENQEAWRHILLGGASSSTTSSDNMPRKRYRDSTYRRSRSRSRDRDHHANIPVPVLKSISEMRLSSS